MRVGTGERSWDFKALQIQARARGKGYYSKHRVFKLALEDAYHFWLLNGFLKKELAYLVETFVRRKQRWLITWTSNAHLAMLENAHTGVGGPEVDADSGLLGHDARVDLVVE